MEVSILNTQDKLQIEEELFNLIGRVVAKCFEVAGLPDEDVEVSVVLTDDREIRELNARYRGVDAPTDVLSFALEEGEKARAEEELEGEDIRLLGDIVISLETAARQAAEANHAFSWELAWLVAHGTLHLLGYDHQDDGGYEVMRGMEEEATSRAYSGIGTKPREDTRNL